MIAITLTGLAAKIIGRKTINLDIRDPAEALKALSTLFPAFKAYMHRCAEAQQYWRVCPDKNFKGITEEHLQLGIRECLHIIPVTSGSGGFLKILVGVLLIASAPFLGGLGLGVGASFFTTTGIGLVLSGISSLLSPKPSTDNLKKDETQNKSNYFTGPASTVGQGQVIPVVYGKMLIGGHVISQSLSSQAI